MVQVDAGGENGIEDREYGLEVVYSVSSSSTCHTSNMDH